jgi:hypothetical protein
MESFGESSLRSHSFFFRFKESATIFESIAWCCFLVSSSTALWVTLTLYPFTVSLVVASFTSSSSMNKKRSSGVTIRSFENSASGKIGWSAFLNPAILFSSGTTSSGEANPFSASSSPQREERPSVYLSCKGRFGSRLKGIAKVGPSVGKCWRLSK